MEATSLPVPMSRKKMATNTVEVEPIHDHPPPRHVRALDRQLPDRQPGPVPSDARRYPNRQRLVRVVKDANGTRDLSVADRSGCGDTTAGRTAAWSAMTQSEKMVIPASFRPTYHLCRQPLSRGPARLSGQ